jgi:DNA/RNA endonuclease YhcR with UshA esterase domain
MSTASPGLLRRVLARLTSDEEQVETQRLQRDTAVTDATPCAQLPDRAQATATGTLRTVAMRPRAGVPALEVELFDGSGTLTLIFMGRRRIRGIEPGRHIVAHGLVCETEGRRTMFNPRYELRPVGRT